jgi:oligopeptide transport system ATP-binding protein
MLDGNGFIDKGSIIYNGMDLAKFRKEKEWRKIRGGEIAMVFQDPMTSLNPLKTISQQITEAITLHNKEMSAQQARARAAEYIRDVGIENPERRGGQFPHEFSGGMRQRIVIAIGRACNPKILICDEPTTALDVPSRRKY